MNKYKECNQCPHEFNDKNLEPCKDCVPKKKTNADRIRAMSDEELDEFLAKYGMCELCEHNGKNCPESRCEHGYMKWLQSEAE